VHKSNHTFIIILVANFFFFLNFSQLMLLPKFIVHLGMGPADIGCIMGFFSISVLVALPLVGLLSERISKKIFFLIGASLMCFSTPLYAYITHLGPAIFTLRIVQGLGFACAFGITGAMVFEIGTGKNRRALLGMLTASNITTHAIGPAFGEYMIHAWGFGPFFFSAAFFGLLGFLLGFFLPAKKGDGYESPNNFTRFLPFMIAAAVLGIVFGTAVMFLPSYLLSVGIGNSSAFFIAFVCGSLIVWFVLVKALDHLNESFKWIAMVLLMLSLPLWAGAINSLTLLVGLSLAFGIGYGYLYPTINAFIIDSLPGKKGVANSLFVWSFNLGMLLASFGVGMASDLFGYQKSFVLIGLLGMVLLFMKGWLHRSWTQSYSIS